jgi:hypothetical protein
MIPPLVALIATANEATQRSLALAIVDRLKERGTPEPSSPVSGTLDSRIEQLPPLALRRLVPDAPGLPVVGELLGLLRHDQLVPGLRSQSEVMSVRAGLYLIHDYVDDAHQLAQAADDVGSNTTASYWHAIVHRREPDYDNARYWFRRIASHAVFDLIARDVSEFWNDSEFRSRLSCDRLLDSHGRWDAMAFVDLCQECGKDWSDRAQAAARLQEIEMRRLLEYTCQVAQD